jgi:hypothetical protein
MLKSFVAAVLAASLAVPFAPALALDATVTQVDKNPDGTSTFHFTIRTEANETLSPGQPVTAGDFVTIYNFYGFVENSAKSPDGWVFSSEEFGRTPMLNGYPMVAPIDIPNTPNLTWTVTKPVAAGAQVAGFTATTRMAGTTQGQYSAQVTRQMPVVKGVPAGSPLVAAQPVKQALIGPLPTPTFLIDTK